MGNLQTSKKTGCFSFFLQRLFKSKFLQLIGAIKTGNLARVKYYYANKVNFSRYMDNGDTPLHVAVKYNRVEIVKFICENLPNFNVNDRNFVGDTPLLIASMNGNPDIVRCLIAHNAAPDIPENRGYTAFIAACANGNADIVKFLVNRGGANFKIKTNDGQTGLHRAAFYGNYDVLVYLIKDLKMNILVPDRKGNIPLHLACMKLNITCARLLIKANVKDGGASLYLKNKYGVSPLDTLVKQFNRLREPGEDREYKEEEIEEYLRDKHNYPNRKAHPSSPGPSQTVPSHRRASVLDRATDLKRKFKDFFNRNSLFGTPDNMSGTHHSVEPDTILTPKSENIFLMEENPSYIPPSNEDEIKMYEDTPDIVSEEQRLTGSESRLLSPGRHKPSGPLTFGNNNKKILATQTRAAGLFISKLSTIRKAERSPSTILSSDTPMSLSLEPKTHPKTLKRSASNASSALNSSVALSEDNNKPVPPSHFATRTKSRFAFQNP